MREVSPAENLTAQEFYLELAPKLQRRVDEIRRQKREGVRPRPSTLILDSQSSMLTAAERISLVDKVANLVDENLCGRSEMCMQFAELLARALAHLGLQSARPVVGEAIYFVGGKEIFRWQHTWVRVEDEVVDANVDILFENPEVPETVKVRPYWGPVRLIPPDRRLREDHGSKNPDDVDVETLWWPELRRSIGPQ